MNNTYDLLKFIEEEIDSKYKSNKKLLKILDKIKSGKITYEDAHNYSIELGKIISNILGEKISLEALIDGKLEKEAARTLIYPVLKKNHQNVSKVCISAQDLMNKKNNLNINSVKTKIPNNKINGIITYASSADDFNKIKLKFNNTIVNYSQKNVDEYVRVNADFLSRSGLKSIIIRTAKSKCCKWCSDLAGVYDYSEHSFTGDDVLRRHSSCECMIALKYERGYENISYKNRLNKDEIKDIENKLLKNKLNT